MRFVFELNVSADLFNYNWNHDIWTQKAEVLESLDGIVEVGLAEYRDEYDIFQDLDELVDILIAH